MLWFLLAVGCLVGQQRPNGIYATFHTEMGDIVAKLYEKDTPIAVATFVRLAQGVQQTRDPKTGKAVYRRIYDNITFHRVVRDQMIQSGDPTGTGSFNCGFTIRDEILPGLRFDGEGKLAMANTGSQDSGGCQFFITVDPMPAWTGHYTIFGYVVSGMDVAHKINRMPLKEDRPVTPVKLNSVTVERLGPAPVAKVKKAKN